MNIKKVIGKIYGLIRSSEEYLDNFATSDNFLDKLLNMVRSDCSDILFSKEEIDLNIFNDENEEYQFTINIINED